jgi:hypothetical protein
MKKASIVDAFVYFKDWFSSKFIQTSLILRPLSQLKQQVAQKLLPSKSSDSHYNFFKIIKGIIGFIPIGIGSYYIGYESANKVNFNEFIKYLRSEDEIYSLLEKGRSVITFMYLPGEMFSEFTHSEFHKAAHKYYQ